MLKIKDNVDLKELENFGFKPKYSEENGELVEYFHVNLKETGLPMGFGISIRKKDTSTKKKNWELGIHLKEIRMEFHLLKKIEYGLLIIIIIIILILIHCTT